MTKSASVVAVETSSPARTQAELASIARFKARGVRAGDAFNMSYHRSTAFIAGAKQSATRGLTDDERSSIDTMAMGFVSAKRSA